MSSLFPNSNSHLEQSGEQADKALKSGRSYLNDAVEQVSARLQDTRERVSPAVSRVASQASDYAKRGVDVMKERSAQLRDTAYRASDNTVGYIKDEPVKSILIAVAAGAAIMAAASWISSRSSRRDW